MTLNFVEKIKEDMGQLESSRARLAASAGSSGAQAALEDARHAALKAFATLEGFIAMTDTNAPARPESVSG